MADRDMMRIESDDLFSYFAFLAVLFCPLMAFKFYGDANAYWEGQGNFLDAVGFLGAALPIPFAIAGLFYKRVRDPFRKVFPFCFALVLIVTARMAFV
ncbi:MAG: hypothetical protein ACFB22_00290 [Rhodothalassiaceae bacterium]